MITISNRGNSESVAPVMTRCQSEVNSLEKNCRPTGSVNIFCEEVTISGQRKAFQLPRKLKIQRAPMAAMLSGRAIRQ